MHMVTRLISPSKLCHYSIKPHQIPSKPKPAVRLHAISSKVDCAVDSQDYRNTISRPIKLTRAEFLETRP